MSGSGAWGVAADPYTQLFGLLFRRGVTIPTLARHCGFAESTAERITMGEVNTIRQDTAAKALKALELVPFMEIVEALVMRPIAFAEHGGSFEIAL